MMQALKKLIGNRNPIRLLWHRAKGFVAALINGFPAKKLYIIGITGTDGKTTTVGMAAHILSSVGIPCGALSTAFVKIRDEQTWNETQKTSPSPFVIQKFLKDCVQAKCTHVVLECSSHGLVQGRLATIRPQVAAITNISPEHLDYHRTMKQYIKDKGLLFKMLKGRGTKVLNRDDQTFEQYSRIPSRNTVTYSSSGPDATLTLTEIVVTQKKSSAWIHSEEEDNGTQLILNIPGGFNLENAMCAIACTQNFASLRESCRALSKFSSAPARMEPIEAGQDFSVYVDFTVTPAAFKKTLSTLREMIPKDKKVLVLTGSCGDRMKEKRPEVGKICSELADIVAITNDEPYTEDPQAIIDEVWAGIDQSQCEAAQMPDRKKAMEWIFSKANQGDAVLLCGLGSYPYIMTAEGPQPWNEQEIATEILKRMH